MGSAQKANVTDPIAVPGPVIAMMAVNPVLAKAWLDLIKQSANFVSDRLERDIELQARLMACRDPATFMQVQSDYLRETLEHYAEETARAFKLAFKSADDLEEDARHGHRRNYDDIPL